MTVPCPEDRVSAALAALTDAQTEFAAAIRELVRENSRQASDGPVALMSVAEASRRMSISRSTLYQAMAAGRVRSIRVQGRRLLSTAEVARIAAGERGEAS